MTKARKRDVDLPAGISRIHKPSCGADETGDVADCTCRPRYQAQAGPKGHRKTKTHDTKTAAIGWKRDIEDAFGRGDHLRAAAPTVDSVVTAWLQKAEKGIVLTRSRRKYRESTLRAYKQAYDSLLAPELGALPVDHLKRGRLNELAEDLQARGLSEQTVRNAFIPLRAVLRNQVDLERLDLNVTRGMVVPSGSGRREQTIEPAMIERYLDALDYRDRPLWGTLILAGLRRGEAMALLWSDVDLAAGEITVRRAYDPRSKKMEQVKSDAGQDRRIPVCGRLRELLLEHRARAGARPTGLVFARETLGARRVQEHHRRLPFADAATTERARAAWNAAGLPPVTMHVCRHTFASVLIAAWATAGTFDPKALQEMLGHASIQQTYDRYGHLFPGATAQAARVLDAYIGAAADRASETRFAAERLLATLEESDARDVVAVAHDTAASLKQWLADADAAIQDAGSSSGSGDGAVFVQRPAMSGLV